jgi:hypothetical protein
MRHVTARQGHGAILQRLAQHLQHIARKFGELVQEKHAVVSQAHLARPRHARAAADQPSVGHRMMGRP